MLQPSGNEAEWNSELSAGAAGYAAQLRAIVEERVHVGNWRLELRTNEVYLSDHIFRTRGLASTLRPTLETALATYHPADRERVRQLIAAGAADGAPFRFRSRVVRPDGSIRHVVAHGQAERLPDGSINALFGTFQDVTATHQAAAYAKLHHSLQACDDGTGGQLELGVCHQPGFLDNRCSGIYGLAHVKEALTFGSWAGFVHPHDRARTQREFDVSDAEVATETRRRFAAALARSGFAPDDIADAELIFGELIGNVKQHAAVANHVRISIDQAGPTTVLHVADAGPGFDFVGRLPAECFAETGRGMFLIDALSAGLHVTRRPGGGSHARVVLTDRRCRC